MTTSSSEATASDPVFAEALGRIVRGGWDELESSVVEFASPITVDGTSATVRCHFLRSDPNGKTRLDSLARQLADQVIHYCIPRSEIERAQALPADRAPQAISRLAREAERLFTQTQVKTGEGAELLLYTLLEKQLGIPQVLSKMSLKTSTEMQIHGADGVHAQMLPTGDLAIYWGEAKVYESVADAMSDCMDSLAPYLAGRAYEQDVFLIRHYADTGDSLLTEKLLEYFDDGSIKSASVEMRGACLIGFSHAEYPNLPKGLEAVRAELEATLATWAKGIRTRLINRGLESYVIEVFFVPVPSAQEFRDSIKRELRVPVIP